MPSKQPTYKTINRTELNLQIDRLIQIRNEIREVFATPISEEITETMKIFTLQDLDEQESFCVLKIAELKNLIKPSKN
jgi:hypothetical protein